MDLIFESESKLHKILVSIKFIFIVNIITFAYLWTISINVRFDDYQLRYLIQLTKSHAYSNFGNQNIAPKKK